MLAAKTDVLVLESNPETARGSLSVCPYRGEARDHDGRELLAIYFTDLNKDEMRHLSDIPTRTKPLARRTLRVS